MNTTFDLRHPIAHHPGDGHTVLNDLRPRSNPRSAALAPPLRPEGREVRRMIRRALRTSALAPSIWTFPSILLEAPAECFIKRRGRTKTGMTCHLLEEYGLKAQSARTNIFGYAEFLHALTAVAPWHECILDIEHDPKVLPDPLYVIANQRPLRQLLTLYRAYSRALAARHGFTARAPSECGGAFIGEEIFRDKLTFARCLGTEWFERLYGVLFDEYRFWLVNGAPDLIVWDPRVGSDLWFLAEVKGPRDSLTRSQLDWIRRHWATIQGRFLLLVLEPELADAPSEAPPESPDARNTDERDDDYGRRAASEKNGSTPSRR